MKLWLAVAGVLVVVSSPCSAFLYPDEDDSMIPGVRPRPTSGNPGGTSIRFPDTSSVTRGALAPVPVPDQQPATVDLHALDRDSLDLLNTITDISDFAQMFNLSLPEEDDFGNISLTVRISGTSDEPAELASMANCKPELRTVELDLPHDPQTTFYPTCVRVEQCGGCCFGPLLTCRPSVTKVLKVKVLKTTSASSGSSRRSRPGRRRRRENTASYHTVSVVKHTSCECGCKVQASDCNSTIHTYREGECACVCKDRDEKTKCEEQNSTKYWSDETCSCYCRRPLSCGSGEFFSQFSCRCEHLTGRSGIVFEEGSAS
ncbi:platelet-derived growth factor subunit B-like [Penaeus japonicus]|uniref:platelet-derived growth factor subunit B-like n=1 Tax=Penaeus japonicus TaxID=27405 RepID=UPI001C7115DF|nr:platelet-derived growth factor subunit B-like [Penaeus japonicus]